MTPRFRISLLATIASLPVATAGAADPKQLPQLVLRATYDTGLGANGSEIISIRHTDGLAALTNVAGSVDVLDLSDPLNPRLVRRVETGTALGTPNSVAIHPADDYFLVAIGKPGATGLVSAYRLSDGALLASASVGIQPDSIAISPNGKHAVVANEAEATGTGQNGGAGSISIIDLTEFDDDDDETGALAIVNVPIPALTNVVGVSTGRTDDIARLPIDNTPGTIEPESVAFSRNSRFAFVTLQENNAVVKVDMHSRQLTFFGVGQTTHAADLLVNGAYQPVQVLMAFREPDGIALNHNGHFFVTADEGDTRNAAGAAGPRGGRTVSVFDAEDGILLGDTGSQLDDAAANAGIYPDNRSNRGASEPEGLDLIHHRGMTLAAVTLERANAVALIDLTEPTAPAVIAIERVGTGPEGIKFFRRGSRVFAAAANEVDGTLSILEVTF